MKLIQLELENIRSYQQATIKFPEGITLFEGDIGSGKSTILMAIEFVLFGLGDQKADSLLRMKETKGSVVLSFSVENKYYKVGRYLERKKKTKTTKDRTEQLPGFIVEDGVKSVKTSRELKPRILQILGFNENSSPTAKSVIFRYAIFTPQEEMKEIINESPEKRMETLRKALRLEDYKIAQENALRLTADLKSVRNQKTIIENDIEGKKQNINANNTEITTKQNVINDQLKEKAKLQKIIDDLSKLISELTTKKQGLISMQEKAEGLKDHLQRNQDQIQTIENDVKEYEKEIQNANVQIKSDQIDLAKQKEFIKPCEFSAKELQGDQDQVNNVLVKKDRFNTQIKALQTKLKDYQKELGDLEKISVQDLEQQISALREQLTAKRIILEDLNAQELEAKQNQHLLSTKIEEKTQELADFTVLGEKCPTCSQPITVEFREQLILEKNQLIADFKKKLAIHNIKLKKIKPDQDKIKEESDLIQKEVEKLNSHISPLKNLENDTKKIDIFTNEIKKLEKELNISKKYTEWNPKENPYSYLDTLRKKREQYDNAQEKITFYTRNITSNENNIKVKESAITKKGNEKNNITEQNKKQKSDLAKIQIQLKEFEPLLAREKEINHDIQNQQGSLQQVLGIISEKTGEINSLKSQNQGYAIELKKAEDMRKKTLLAFEYYNWMDQFFNPALPEIERRIFAKIYQDFNDYFHQYFQILVPDPTKEARIDENFTPLVEQDQQMQNIDFLSGGEKTSVALSYRLALNKTIHQTSSIGNTDLLIFDEPTDGFSKEQLFKFRDILAELNCPQIILVSHEQELESFSNQIFFVEKNNGISTIQQRKQ